MCSDPVLQDRFNTHAHLNGILNKTILLSRLVFILFSFIECFCRL